MNGVAVVTFGCRLNAYESEAIRLRASEAGLSNAVIVNTCAVTGEAVRQSRQAIRKLRRENPSARIIVTGCAAQTEPETYAAMPEIDHVLGNSEKLIAANYVPDFLDNAPRAIVNDIMSVKETAAQFVQNFGTRARAVLQVQTGCDHRCTFCIIPYGRGNSRSVGAGAVIREARQLAEAGFREIVLSGVDLTAYGSDLPGKPSLGTLVAQVLKHVPELPRLRLSSIDSIEVDDALLPLIAEQPRLMPHFHLSVQSGDNLILKRMKRRHSRDDTIRFCDTVRRLRPDAAFGADVIVGFPTETEVMYENTVRLIGEAGLSYLHVFPFSARSRTPAAKMPQVPPAEVKNRARRLRAAGDAALAARLSTLIGTETVLLVETSGFGRTPCFAGARVSEPCSPGTLVRAFIAGSDGRVLYARVLSPVQQKTMQV